MSWSYLNKITKAILKCTVKFQYLEWEELGGTFMGNLASQLCEHQTVGRTKHFINQMNNWVLGPEENGADFTKEIELN